MRAVIVHVREEEFADRRAKGLDRWDEMWEGVLHMTPAPSLEHQRMLDTMVECLRPRLRETGRGALYSGINVFRDSGAGLYDKLPFYAALRVREVIVCHRDSKEPEGFRLAGPRYVAVQRDADGWLASDALRVRFQRTDATPPQLRIEDVEDRSVHVEI